MTWMQREKKQGVNSCCLREFLGSRKGLRLQGTRRVPVSARGPFALWIALCFLWCFTLFHPGTALAGDTLKGGMGAHIGYQRGHNTWGMEITQYDPGISGTYTVESELDWPLDFLTGGVSAFLEGECFKESRWSVEVSFLTNLSDPGGTMDDSDWLTAASAGIPRTKFIYTESSVEAQTFLGEIGARLTLYHWLFNRSSLDLDLLLGYRHEYYEFDAYGGNGWYLDDHMNKVWVEVSESIHVVHYTTNHMLPYAGFSFRSRAFERLLIDTGIRIFGVFSRDRDDHVVRNKELNGNAKGIGVGLNVAPRWQLIGASEDSFSLSLGTNLYIEYLHAFEGTLKQAYYADDPTLPGDQTLEQIPDADFHVKSLLYGVLATVEVSF